MGGGILNTKNAFTLIELLAIIVILAIIAVITVPIILNIIENSRKGAATDSAYGFKDAVNKTYVTELSKPNQEGLKLNGTYEVQSDGTLVPADGYSFGITNYNTLPVSVSGEKPTSGTLIYDNNVLASGTLIIGDYTATYSNGSFTAVKTSSISTEPVEEPQQGGVDEPDPYSMAEMCPGCVFGKYMSTAENEYDAEYLDEEPKGTYTSSYSEYGNNFLGFVIEEYNGSQYISQSFVCGKEENKYFCLEYAEDAFDKNVDILLHFFNGCSAPPDDNGYVGCGTNGYAYTYMDKDVGIGECFVGSGAAGCSE